MSSIDNIRRKLEDIEQEHLLKFWDGLTGDEQATYLHQLNGIKWDEVSGLFQRAITSLNDVPDLLDKRMEPVPPSQFESQEGCDAATLAMYHQLGLREIAEGRVSVLLMAGGQGTRLGVSYPKGMYSVGLPSGKTLFQIQAERIRRIQEIAEEATGRRGRIPWYIMTSGPTNKATDKYLKANNYFGLSADDVVLFKQGLLPCFDFNGKVIADGRNSVALAPDGNGGIYRALADNGVLDDMGQRGVHYVHAHSVDNILVKVADPTFIGYCVNKGADCGAKVVKKVGPAEAVGVVCQVDGKFQVVEYSEITESTANLRNERGDDLLFNAGNICNHLFSTDFLRRVAARHECELKLHVAKKKIPHVDGHGHIVMPTVANGIKIEKFVFDVFQFSDNFVTWEIPRASEFSALKNADDAGKDCPMTARNDLLKLHKAYVETAGGIVNSEVEISPLLSYCGENLETKVKGIVFNCPTVLASNKEANDNNNKTLNGFDN